MSVSPSSPAPAATPVMAPRTRVGHVDVERRRDTPMFAGAATGNPDGYPSLDRALRDAARTSLDADGAAQMVLRAQQAGKERFFTQELHQPLWDHGFFRDNAHDTRPVRMEAPAAQPAGKAPVLRFVSQGTTDDPFGTFVPDAKTGQVLAAVVSNELAVVGSELRTVKATPKPVPKPISVSNPDASLIRGLTEATRLVDVVNETLADIPPAKALDEKYTATRKKAWDTNMSAQKELEGQFLRDNMAKDLVSQLRKADAFLEDAGWQTITKPSPDKRFNGVDIPGAVSNAGKATAILKELLAAATKK